MKNLENIIHIILSDHLNELPRSFKNVLKPKNAFLNIRHSLGTLRWNFLQMLKKENLNASLNGKIWVMFESDNNYNALSFLKGYDNVFVNPRIEFNYKYQFSTQLKSILKLLIYLGRKGKLDFYFNYFYRMGLYEESLRYLTKLKPEKIIFSNDHNPKQRAFILAARDLGIKTYYFQHACTTKYFPPLEFYVAFLDGQDAVDKYTKIGNRDCILEKVGMIRGNELRMNTNSNTKVHSIGIAINLIDDISKVLDLIKKLRKQFPNLKISLRPHPSMNKLPSELKTYLEENSIEINNSILTAPHEFLQKIDLLVAGNSSILLEAAIMNVIPVSYKLYEGKTMDSYGFIEKGLAERLHSMSGLIEFIKMQIESKSNKYHQMASYYDESLSREINWKVILKKYGLLN